MRYSIYLKEWLKSKPLTTPNAREDVEQQELSFIADGKANDTVILEDSLTASFKTKHALIIWVRNHTHCFYPINWKVTSTQKTFPWRFTATLIRISKTWKQPRCPSVDKWIKKKNILWLINTMEYCSAIKRNEVKFPKDINKLKMHIAKWNKTIWKDCTLYDSNYMTFS